MKAMKEKKTGQKVSNQPSTFKTNLINNNTLGALVYSDMDSW